MNDGSFLNWCYTKHHEHRGTVMLRAKSFVQNQPFELYFKKMSRKVFQLPLLTTLATANLKNTRVRVHLCPNLPWYLVEHLITSLCFDL